MALVAALFFAIALGVLAVRYGRDSRDGLRSEEEALAAAGFSWPGRPGVTS
jgi:hypothetical protein